MNVIEQEIEKVKQNNPLKGWMGLAEPVPHEEMSFESTKMWMMMELADKADLERVYNNVKDKPWINVLINRIEAVYPTIYSSKMEKRPIIFVGACYCDRPGAAVMWAYTLVAMYVRDGRLNMSTLANTFPDGFPNIEEVGKLWDHQKGYKHGLKLDNLLDCYECWPASPEVVAGAA